jgi:hypothetical protein
MIIIPDDIEVRLKIINKPPMLARVAVIFGKTVETNGWRVLTSVEGIIHPRFQEKIWIQPPSYMAGREKNGKVKYSPLVWVANEKLYAAIEDKIYDAYCLKRHIQEKSDAYDQILTINNLKDDTL